MFVWECEWVRTSTIAIISVCQTVIDGKFKCKKTCFVTFNYALQT